MGRDAMEISLTLIFLSFCLYIVYGRKEKQRESAMLHLLKRITDSRLMGNLLEDELREVLINRDEIDQDGFDALVKEASVLDWTEPVTFEEMLEKVADDLAEEAGMNRKALVEAYVRRQRESNTALSPFLAIPHIVTEGEKHMFLSILRCREGVRFTDEQDRVKAVFLLGGTADNRNLHLKVLAAIASLAETKDFEQRWMDGADETELKNLLLLNDRKREG